MALTRVRKEELVAEYTEMLEQSKAIIFTEYRGLNNTELTKVRRAVREANGVYRITKLTLLKLALEAGGYPVPEDLSGAPVAVGFCFDEIPGVAKALIDYAEDEELMVIRTGIMDGDFLSESELEAIAKLPSLDGLRSQLLGLLDAPASNLVGVLQAGVSQVINVVNAYADSESA